MTDSDSIPYRIGSAYAVPLMLFFVAVLLFIALLQSQKELTALCLVTFGVMAGAYFCSRASLRAIEFELDVERSHLFPQEHLKIRLDVVNAKALPIHLSVNTAVAGESGTDRNKETEDQSSGMLGYQKATFHWDLVVGHRGIYSVGPLHVTTGDPFGFFPRQSRVPIHREIVVYPRLVPLRPVAFPRCEAFGAPGGRSHVRDPVHLLGTRDYQPSEPARHIHWKATARHSRLQIKVFAPSRQEKLLLLLDASGFARQPDDSAFEKILEVIASLAEQRERRGSATGLLTNAKLHGTSRRILPPARNPGQMALIMETLARCTRAATGDLLRLLRHSYDIPWGTSCVLFSSGLEQETQLVRTFIQRRRIPLEIFTCEKALALREGHQ